MPKKNNMGKRPKVKDPIGTLKRILSYMSDFKLQLLFISIFIIMSALADVVGTYLLKPIINDYIMPLIGKENPDMSGFVKILLVMAIVYILGAISTYVYNKLMINVSTGTIFKIRTDMFSHMQKLPIKYFDTHSHGEIMSRYTNDIDTLRDMMSQSFAQFVSTGITLIGVFIMMIVLSPILTVLVIVMLIVIQKILKVLGEKSGKYFSMQQKKMGMVNGHIEEMVEGQKVVKVFCREDNSKEEFGELNEELCEAAKSANTIGNVIMPIMGNLSYIHYAITAMAGGILSVTVGLDIGTIASFLQYTRSFSQPITQMSQMFNSVIVALAGAERIFDLMDEASEADQGYVTLVNAKIDDNGNITECNERTNTWAWKHPHGDGTLTYTPLKGEVTFNDVVFGYNEKETVLNNISMAAKPGEKIALVGSTGAGKTTITNLINRFYDIPDGKIRYDGININKIRKDDLRRSLGMVLQDTHLFTGTIRDNIRYGRLDATDKEIVEAAKLANADSFIKHLPKGYDTVITGDGGNLSQGQRQLLAIARAAVADPPVLILDEATSSIDTRTESIIQKGMDKLMAGRTVFVIAHRLSTIRNSDEIMVMEHGRIIERGNHDKLLKDRGRYYQLYTGMFELA